jgi:hypothetical protein
VAEKEREEERWLRKKGKNVDVVLFNDIICVA